MNDGSACMQSPRVLRHKSLPALQGMLAGRGLWFALPDGGLDALRGTSLYERAEAHCFEAAAGLIVNDLRPEDLPLLREHTPYALLQGPAARQHDSSMSDSITALQASGIRLFRPHGHGDAAGRETGTPIGRLEFLLSSHQRLRAYPASGGAGPQFASMRSEPVRAVFVLDLVQDLEILESLLVLASRPGGPIQPCVAVTERFAACHLWLEASRQLQALGLPWFKPLGVADVTSALGTRRSLLVTASETSAPGHAFSHLACRCAPPSTLRVTFQHGYECVGLKHHRAHDVQFPQGIRFESDLIFTWRVADELDALHPGDCDKCVPVGVVKAIAHDGALLLEADWAGSSHSGERNDADRALLIAENLHSVRFASPSRYQRFLDFIRSVQAQRRWPVAIRSHPGKRTLELQESRHEGRFLEGTLAAHHLRAALMLISPPSTILLDAALCATPSAVWSDAAGLGDTENYTGLPAVTDVGDLWAALSDDLTAAGLRAHAWAVANTSALDGVHAAWRSLCGLVT